ncbi:MAG: alpha/beta hydrolase [Chloroflexota bacterium]
MAGKNAGYKADVKPSPIHPFRSAQTKAEYHAHYMERAKSWPVASETRLIETPSGSTFVRLSGRAENPPLILLPGSLATSLTWIPNIAALSAHYRTYALDSIYDFGLSVRRKRLAKPDDLVTWLDETTKTLVPEGKFHLAGLSYGGWLASQFAVRFPERVHKLVLIAPAMTVLPVSLAVIFRALLTRLPFPGFHRQFYYWFLQDAVQSGETGRAVVAEAVTDWLMAKRCFRPMPLIPATLVDDETWRNFKTPCLFLVGEHEKMYPAQKALDRLRRVAPQIEAEVISNAGHDLTFSQAEVVTGKMVEFLADPAQA